jgi:hypothetical protein
MIVDLVARMNQQGVICSLHIHARHAGCITSDFGATLVAPNFCLENVVGVFLVFNYNLKIIVILIT